VARVAAIMADVQPDTLLTFGPDGMTGHPDQISASRWATAAFARVAPAGATLHYSTHTRARLDSFRAKLDELNVFMGAEPPCTPDDELSIAEKLDGEVLDTKLRAIRCMTSQVEPLVNALGEDYLRDGTREEVFRRP
jgi:LmbE family N-acetylglucosaminyl deacetylase